MLIKKLLIIWVFIKDDTVCPLSPCPSQTQKHLSPNGNFCSTNALSWLILVCFPFVPAFVLIIVLNIWCFNGYNLRFFVEENYNVADWTVCSCLIIYKITIKVHIRYIILFLWLINSRKLKSFNLFCWGWHVSDFR